MRVITIILFLFLAFLLGRYYELITQKPRIIKVAPTPTPYIFSQQKLWDLVQNWRSDNGLFPFIKNQKLCDFATKRLSEIKNDWGHSGYTQNRQNYGFNFDGENLAKDYFTEEETLNAWLSSASHSANLKRTYVYSCLKCDRNICAQEFGSY